MAQGVEGWTERYTVRGLTPRFHPRESLKEGPQLGSPTDTQAHP